MFKDTDRQSRRNRSAGSSAPPAPWATARWPCTATPTRRPPCGAGRRGRAHRPAPAAESYLQFDAILGACKATGADALHPGYGFLSENAAFAQACQDAGVVFIGPPPSAIEAMGDKAPIEQRMIAAGVPCAPATWARSRPTPRWWPRRRSLGYPLLVKAVAGGGGRGMRW